jgi:hypothetical protein
MGSIANSLLFDGNINPEPKHSKRYTPPTRMINLEWLHDRVAYATGLMLPEYGVETGITPEFPFEPIWPVDLEDDTNFPSPDLAIVNHSPEAVYVDWNDVGLQFLVRPVIYKGMMALGDMHGRGLTVELVRKPPMGPQDTVIIKNVPRVYRSNSEKDRVYGACLEVCKTITKEALLFSKKVLDEFEFKEKFRATVRL